MTTPREPANIHEALQPFLDKLNALGDARPDQDPEQVLPLSRAEIEDAILRNREPGRCSSCLVRAEMDPVTGSWWHLEKPRCTHGAQFWSAQTMHVVAEAEHQ